MRNFIRPILVASPLVFAIPAFAASIQYDDTVTNANGAERYCAPSAVSQLNSQLGAMGKTIAVSDAQAGLQIIVGQVKDAATVAQAALTHS